MSRIRSKRKSKFKVFSAIVVAIVLVGGFLAVRSHNKAAVLSAVTTPDARNQLRRQHMELLSSALRNYIAQAGKLPVKVPVSTVGICSGTGAVCKSGGQVDLLFLTSTEHLTAIPNDPSGGPGQHTTGYTIVRLPATDEIEISAPRAENGAEISETISLH